MLVIESSESNKPCVGWLIDNILNKTISKIEDSKLAVHRIGSDMGQVVLI